MLCVVIKLIKVNQFAFAFDGAPHLSGPIARCHASASASVSASLAATFAVAFAFTSALVPALAISDDWLALLLCVRCKFIGPKSKHRVAGGEGDNGGGGWRIWTNSTWNVSNTQFGCNWTCPIMKAEAQAQAPAELSWAQHAPRLHDWYLEPSPKR